MFTVKWDYGDTNIDFANLQPHQFVNHFPDSRELTTKQGITKNLNAMASCGSVSGHRLADEYFPRSFDMSDPNNVKIFMKEFHQTALM